jgi:hypothetical protein
VRSWHQRPEARAIFAEAFLKTPYGDWLREAGIDESSGVLRGQSDVDLSVLVLCNGGIDMRSARLAIDSVRDIADEVVLVEPDEFGRLEVLKRIEICKAPSLVVPKSTRTAENGLAPYIARFPWVLVLHQNESVTPFLAKELQQRIAEAKDSVASRIALEVQYFGRTMAHRKSENPIRLFRQADCSLHVGSQDVTVTADSDRTGRLTGTILACQCATVEEFVERLNEQTTAAAIRRADADENPQLFRGALRATWKFLSSCSMRSGWTGLQIAALESVFLWLEEAKLYQRAAEFRALNSQGEIGASDSAPPIEKASIWKKAA